MKKSTFNVAFGGMISALCIVLMFSVSFLPIMLYVFPMLCSILMGILLETSGQKTAWSAFAAVSMFSLLLCSEKEAVMFYVGFFGFYPMVRVHLEKIKSKALVLISKIALFNLSVVLIYVFLISIFGLASVGLEEGTSAWLLFAMLAVGNVIFLMYDKVIIIYVKLIGKKIVSRMRFKNK